MKWTRRHFLHNAGIIGFGFVGLRSAIHRTARAQSAGPAFTEGYGPLVKDPDRLMDLPDGFRYRILSRAGEPMSDGFQVPGKHDGMAAFPGPGGRVILVRNHELDVSDSTLGPYGRRYELFDRVSPDLLYDAGKGARPARITGGTTTLVVNTTTGELESHFLSLSGTVRNCAGGPTPWGSWISCEETVTRASSTIDKDHGYCFEVPATDQIGLAKPVPLKAMGRFNHEAVAVDPVSGIVYLTEDRDDGALYRFLPNRPGDLAAGGKLQALYVRGASKTDTRNWSSRNAVPVGMTFETGWVDLENVEAPSDNLRSQSYSKGAARFARGEGMWHGGDAVYFACTSGGSARKGQVWRYTPSVEEGKPGEERVPGRLELFIEPNQGSLIENADNLTMAPWGDLVICEDGDGTDHLVGVTPTGHLYKIARNARNSSELAGAAFSPDGTILFVNIYDPGMTIAITGPWEKLSVPDLNADGRRDLFDVRSAFRMALGLQPFTEKQAVLSDMNRNGQVDLDDVVEMLKRMIGA